MEFCIMYDYFERIPGYNNKQLVLKPNDSEIAIQYPDDDKNDYDIEQISHTNTYHIEIHIESKSAASLALILTVYYECPFKPSIPNKKQYYQLIFKSLSIMTDAWIWQMNKLHEKRNIADRGRINHHLPTAESEVNRGKKHYIYKKKGINIGGIVTMDKKILLLSFLFIFSMISVHADYSDIKSFKNFSEAYRISKKEAEKGNAEAQNELGLLYEEGVGGVAQDYEKAMYWYRKALKGGYIGTAINIGNLYKRGYGVKKDSKKAVEYYRMAINKGEKRAIYCLALMYLTGEGVKKNKAKAIELFKEGAEYGDYVAQSSLAVHYCIGDGIKQDYKKGIYWAKKAVEQGYVPAMQTLSVINYEGKAFPKNLVASYKWSYIGSMNGNPVASQVVNYLDTIMSEADTAKARKEAVEWMRTHKTLNTATIKGATAYNPNKPQQQPKEGYNIRVQTE